MQTSKLAEHRGGHVLDFFLDLDGFSFYGRRDEPLGDCAGQDRHEPDAHEHHGHRENFVAVVVGSTSDPVVLSPRTAPCASVKSVPALREERVDEQSDSRVDRQKPEINREGAQSTDAGSWCHCPRESENEVGHSNADSDTCEARAAQANRCGDTDAEE